MKKLIVYSLILQMLYVPGLTPARADQAPATVQAPETHALIRMLRREVAKNPAAFYEEQEMTQAVALENKTVANEEVRRIADLAKDSSVPLESIRDDIARQAMSEEEAQLIELKYLVKKLPGERVEALFQEAMKNGFYSEDYKAEFGSGYTLADKQAVLYRMLASDLYEIKSVTLKRLGLMGRDQLVQELTTTQTLMNTRGKDTWKTVVIIVLAAAAAGFVAWAVIGATKKKYEQKTRETEQDFEDRTTQLGQDYVNKEAELRATFATRERLREQGYVWQVCSRTETLRTYSCSYDFLTHSGTEVCLDRCLKNPATGDTAMHTTTCSSASLPNNCFVKNPYRDGYDTGYDRGYDDGYDTGYDEAYRRAYYSYYNSGYDKGYLKGYDRGYNKGYSDGLAGYSCSSCKGGNADVHPAGPRDDGNDDSVVQGYKKGYVEGFAMGALQRIGA